MGFRFFLMLVIGLIGIMGGPARAQDPLAPAPIAALEKDGAVLTYLGDDLGFNGWRATKGGEDQYFYASADGKALFLGVMFDAKGHVVTFEQLKRLGKAQKPIAAAENGAKAAAATSAPAPKAEEAGKNSPRAEALIAEMKGAAGFRIGKPSAPVIYTFIDPLCVHCKDLITSALPAVRAGTLAIQAIPVGVIAPQSLPMAAYLLSVPEADAADRYIRLAEKEDITAVPADQTHDTAGVQANMDLMMKWKFDGTPITVYRAASGKIRIVKGSVDDIGVILKDLK